jgi:hypothetical protein
MPALGVKQIEFLFHKKEGESETIRFSDPVIIDPSEAYRFGVFCIFSWKFQE